MLTESELRQIFFDAVGPLTAAERRSVDEASIVRAGDDAGLGRALDAHRNVIVVRDGSAPA